MIVEVSLRRILNNYKTISSLTNREVAAVLKGDAYGHGIRAVATSLMEAGVKRFVVGSFEEASVLVNLGAGWVLWLYPSVRELDRVGDGSFWDVVRVAVADPSTLKYLPQNAKFHLYVDVGFGVYGSSHVPTGFLEDDRLEGVWSHIGWLEDALSESEFRDLAYKRFVEICNSVRQVRSGILCHICGTSMTAYAGGCRETSFARVGVGLYGYAEATYLDRKLSPAMRWFGEVVSVYKTGRRQSIFYDFANVGEGWVVIVKAGYSDGYIPGERAYLPSGLTLERLSHVTMNLTAFWSKEFPDVTVGDAVLLMEDAREIARANGLPLEKVLCSGGLGHIRYVDF
jgi:alanine racemase